MAASRASALALLVFAPLHAINVHGSRTVLLYDASDRLVPYRDGLRWQEALHGERVKCAVARARAVEDASSSSGILGVPDALIMLQHQAVLTLGTASTEDNILTARGDLPFDVVRTTRGGEVTYHGPGQLVAYPIFDLRASHTADLHWYLRTLEGAVIGALGDFGIDAGRIDGLTGVWAGGRKLCAIGVKVSRWVTMHGLALNVDPELRDFEHIVPCGISDRPVGSIAQFVPGVRMDEVRDSLLKHLMHAFALDAWLDAGPDPLAFDAPPAPQEALSFYAPGSGYDRASGA